MLMVVLNVGQRERKEKKERKGQEKLFAGTIMQAFGIVFDGAAEAVASCLCRTSCNA